MSIIKCRLRRFGLSTLMTLFRKQEKINKINVYTSRQPKITRICFVTCESGFHVNCLRRDFKFIAEEFVVPHSRFLFSFDDKFKH